ncbi:MAG: 30S ribosomal protein S3 [Candidatus Moranbacteria bacterium CG_4_10_14_3_um_filter_45_9]|nr:MAG: 30S ribosomal protein S3 [Candidatus Moranbacteria bacterium CG2_30_45_14]PIX90156.1 MAG: 30S ribosomal protein S3 [Candidatus Moranbacteria bacterium CG_4_10_14_3_um_filter_45_9]PJA85913.1 MAG: 30S ribosomal protein S3 [Candidatus Moranbacteria bacterium CG_4_9_14_3_um_filter_45_14]
MGNKVNPTGIRLGITTNWQSRWFGSKKMYSAQLRKDIEIRTFIMSKWKAAAIASVEVDRSANVVKLFIYTARPGVLIGRGGTGIEDLTRAIKKQFFAGKKIDLKVEVLEVKSPEMNAMLVGQQVAEQLEKRLPFRRILKTMLDQVEGNKTVQGVKIEICGRLGGAEMSRREWLSRGKIPLHTLRADIDFARAEAHTTYGVIGIKTWIYKGEKFEKVEGETE